VNDRDEMPDAVPCRTPACRRLSARGRRPGSLKNVRNIKDNRAFPGFERDDVGEPPYDPRTAPVLNEPSVGLGVLQSFQRRVRETFPKDPDQRALSGASSSCGVISRAAIAGRGGSRRSAILRSAPANRPAPAVETHGFAEGEERHARDLPRMRRKRPVPF
jgi:hypothetical protein